MARFVSLLMDVEDPINEASDDAALRCAQALTGLGAAGSLCITGEKLRCLQRRGRLDVLSALRPHASGLHTNTHSFHPSTMELLEDKGWEDGCDAFGTDTMPGVEAFRAAFGKSPAFYGGGGNTWSPQVAGGLPRTGIGAYVYALKSPWMGKPYRFAGCMAFPGGFGIGESNYESEDRFQAAMARVIARAKAARSPWVEIFIGHPTRIRHKEFWDVGYFKGKTPHAPVSVIPYPISLYEEMLSRFERAVRRIKDEFEVLGMEEVLGLPWKFRPARPNEIAAAARVWPKLLRGMAGWPVHKPDLDTSRIVAETLARLGTLEIGELNGCGRAE